MLVILFCSKRRLVEPFFVGRLSLDELKYLHL